MTTFLPSESSHTDDSDDMGGMQPARHRRLNTDPMVTRCGRSKKQGSRDKVYDRVLQLVQFIKRNVDLFVHVPSVMNFGMAHQTIEEYKAKKLAPGAMGYNKEELEAAQQILGNCAKDADVLLNAYNGIQELFKNELGYISELTDEAEQELWREVKKQANQGCNNDKSTLKARTHKIVVKKGLLDPMVDDDDRSSFGINYLQLLRMIIPMSILHKHGKDPSFEADVRGEKYKIDSTSLLAFMFDVDGYDPETPKASLLRGYLPVRVLRHIYTSPKSASDDVNELNERKGTRESNAQIAGVRDVSPEMIAYACVQACLMISKMRQWGEVDERFNIKTFYYQTLKLFKNRRSKWARETLGWLTEQVFNRVEEDEDEQDQPNPDDEASFAKIMAAIDEKDDESEPAAAITTGTRVQAQASQTQPDTQYTQNAFGWPEDD